MESNTETIAARKDYLVAINAELEYYEALANRLQLQRAQALEHYAEVLEQKQVAEAEIAHLESLPTDQVAPE